MNLSETLGRKIFIGHSFTLSNGLKGLRYAGSLNEVCEQVASAGESIPLLWGDRDSQISMDKVRASLLSVVLLTELPIVREVFSRLELAKEQGALCADGHAIRSFLEALSPSQRELVARLIFITGKMSVLTERCLTESLDPLSQDRYGMTALGWGIALGNSRVLEFAIERGISLGHANKYYWNYGDLAARNRNMALAGQLREAGAAPPGEAMLKRMEELRIPVRE